MIRAMKIGFYWGNGDSWGSQFRIINGIMNFVTSESKRKPRCCSCCLTLLNCDLKEYKVGVHLLPLSSSVYLYDLNISVFVPLSLSFSLSMSMSVCLFLSIYPSFSLSLVLTLSHSLSLSLSLPPSLSLSLPHSLSPSLSLSLALSLCLSRGRPSNFYSFISISISQTFHLRVLLYGRFNVITPHVICPVSTNSKQQKSRLLGNSTVCFRWHSLSDRLQLHLVRSFKTWFKDHSLNVRSAVKCRVLQVKNCFFTARTKIRSALSILS